jgi:hypothetical protein
MTGTTRRSFLGAASAWALHAAAPSTPSTARGREIVEKSIHALGGPGFRQMRTRTESGRAYSFYREQITGLAIAKIHTKYLPESQAPVRMVQRQSFGKGKEDTAVLATDKDLWNLSYKGARPFTKERAAQFRDTQLHDVFYIFRMRLDEPGFVCEHHGKDVVENQPVEAVELIDGENRSVTVWIHSSTLLPVKQSFKRWDPAINDRREEVTRYTKYRLAGNGVMWPHDIQRERDKDKIYEMYADKVTVGESLPEALFELPPLVTILKP